VLLPPGLMAVSVSPSRLAIVEPAVCSAVMASGWVRKKLLASKVVSKSMVTWARAGADDARTVAIANSRAAAGSRWNIGNLSVTPSGRENEPLQSKPGRLTTRGEPVMPRTLRRVGGG